MIQMVLYLQTIGKNVLHFRKNEKRNGKLFFTRQKDQTRKRRPSEK